MQSIKESLVIGLMLIITFSFFPSAMAMDLKASLPILPKLSESAEKGILVDLIKAIDEVYEEGTISITASPFQRSMHNVISGKADFHMPLLFNPRKSRDKLAFTHSTETLFSVLFQMYTNKNNKEINLDNLARFKLETDRAHVEYFDFPIKPSSRIEGSLKKVDIERIDGFIFASSTDFELKRLGLKNIKRWKYGRFDSKAVLPKGEKGKQVDLILTKAIQTLKKSGRYEQIMAPILKLNEKFVEW